MANMLLEHLYQRSIGFFCFIKAHAIAPTRNDLMLQSFPSLHVFKHILT